MYVYISINSNFAVDQKIRLSAACDLWHYYERNFGRFSLFLSLSVSPCKIHILTHIRIRKKRRKNTVSISTIVNAERNLGAKKNHRNANEYITVCVVCV